MYVGVTSVRGAPAARCAATVNPHCAAGTHAKVVLGPPHTCFFFLFFFGSIYDFDAHMGERPCAPPIMGDRNLQRCACKIPAMPEILQSQSKAPPQRLKTDQPKIAYISRSRAS